MILVNIALSILVILAGLLLLAKAKKDDLGTVFKIASYTSICVGLIMIGVSLTMCMSNCCAKKGNNRCSKAQQCCQHDGKSGASSSYDMSKCSKRERCCKKKNTKCTKGAQVSSDSTTTGSN